MSEINYTFIFRSQEKDATLKKMLLAVPYAYTKANIKVESIDGHYDEVNKTYFVTLKPVNDDKHKGLKKSLAFLNKERSDTLPFVYVEFDQTNDDLYYILHNRKLIAFDSLSDLEDFQSSDENNAPENIFYKNINNNKNNLLVQLNFYDKEDASGFEYELSKHLTKKSQNSRNELKTYLNSLLKKRTNKDTDFFNPPLNYYQTVNYSFDEETVFDALIFCKQDKKTIYLGFEFEKDIFIEFPHHEEINYGCGEENIKNKDGLRIYSLLDTLWKAIGHEKFKAKFSPGDNIKNVEHSSLINICDGLNCRPCEPFETRIWPA